MTALTHTTAQPILTSPAADLVKQVEAHVEHLAERLARGGSAELLAYLTFAARFHTYSVNNQMLIYLAAPDARFVAGIKKWNEQGRRVLKGSKGIKILAPVTRKDKNDEDQRLVVGFRPVTVFPDTVTEGEPLPEENFMTVRNGGDLALFYRLVSRCPFRVTWTKLGRAHGMTNGHTIILDPDKCSTDAHRIRVLFHEWAHAILHFDGQRKEEEKAKRELEADAVAYILCHMVGIEATAQVSDYLTTWGGNAEALRSSLTNITRAVKVIAEKALKIEANEPAPAA